MKIIYKNRNDFLKSLTEAGASESEINILKKIYSLKVQRKNIKIIFNDSKV